MTTNRRLVAGMVIATGAAAFLGYQAHSAKSELTRFKDQVAAESVRTLTAGQMHSMMGFGIPTVPECLPGEVPMEMLFVAAPVVVESGKMPKLAPGVEKAGVKVTITVCMGEGGMSVAVSPTIMEVARKLAEMSGSSDVQAYVNDAIRMALIPPVPEKCDPLPNGQNTPAIPIPNLGTPKNPDDLGPTIGPI